MSTPANVAVWFDIPATDFDRAVAFYEGLLATRLRPEEAGPDMRMAMFPYTRPGVSGAVMAAPHLKPGADGPVVYLAVDDVDAAMEKVPALGGRLAGPKVVLPGAMGSFVHILDTEGNRVGLHADA